MLPEVLEAIDLEINKVKSSMPSADPDLLSRYFSLLIEANKDTKSPNLLIRPEFHVMTTRNAKLKRLADLYWSRKGRRLSDAIKSMFNLQHDFMTYGILQEIRDLS